MEEKEETKPEERKVSVADEAILSLLNVYGSRFIVELDVKPTKEGIELNVIRSEAVREP